MTPVAGGTVWDVAAAALPLPIWVYDADHRLAGVNVAGLAGQGIDPSLAPIGADLAEMLRVLALRGALGPGDPDALVQRHLGLDRSKPWRGLLRERNGECREMLGVPLPQGGFVVTAVDVTLPLALADEAAAAARERDRILAQLRRGVARFDAADRLVLHNAAYEELLGLPPGHLRPGIDRPGILREIADRGLYLFYCDKVRLDARLAESRNHPESFERERIDGRVIAFSTQAMPGGGYLVEVGDITDLRRAEQEAQHRAGVLHGILEALPHGVVVTDAAGRAAMVNAAHRQIFGDAAARVGEHRDDIAYRRAVSGEYGSGDPAELAAERLREARNTATLRRQRGNGQVVDLRYAPLPAGGHVQVATDITALDAAQREAQERNALLQVMLDTMRHGIALFGPDRRLVAANRLAEQLLGLAPGRLQAGRSFGEITEEQAANGEFGGRDPASIAPFDRTKPLCYTRVRPDGSVIEVISDPTLDGGFVVTYSDITARRAAEHVADARAATLQAMLDHSRHGVAMYDAESRLVAANALFADAIMVPQELVKPGARLAELVALRQAHGGFGDDPEQVEALISQIFALDRRQPSRVQRPLPDGRVFVVASDPTPGGGWVMTYSDVTALVRAEAEARARAALLQTTLDHINHGIVVYGPDRRLVLANRLAGPEHGLPPLAGREGTAFETLLEEQCAAGFFGEQEAAAATLERLLHHDRSLPLRRQRELPDGRIMSVTSDPTPDGGFVITSSDITALRRAEAAAQSRAETLTVMLDNMRHGIMLFDPASRVVAANDLALRLTGLSPDDLARGATISELRLAQVQRGELRPSQGLAAAAAGSIAMNLEPYRRTRPDGTIIEVVTARTPDGGYVRSFTDVTRLTVAEAEAVRRAGIQEAMLDNIRHGILLVDAEGVIVAANRMLSQLLGQPDAVVGPGRTYASWIEWLRLSGEFGAEPAASALAADILDFDRRLPRRIERPRPNGGTLEIISDPTPDGGFILSYSDVTEQRRARAEVERARDAAEAADRAKSRFLATMSHELRTPLNAVIGFSEAIQADPTAPRNLEYLGAIQEAGHHLLGLIDDILDVARTETAGVQLQEAPVDLGAVADAALRVVAGAAAEAGVTLANEWPAVLPPVMADSLRLRQVLLNLLSNAVKFTPRGGRVQVSAAIEASGVLCVAVRDTGVGIEAADIARAFEPFTQIDNGLARRFPGSGLGLYLSRTLAAAHGAELTLESTPGVGTIARLRFPRSRVLTPLAA